MVGMIQEIRNACCLQYLRQSLALSDSEWVMDHGMTAMNAFGFGYHNSALMRPDPTDESLLAPNWNDHRKSLSVGVWMWATMQNFPVPYLILPKFNNRWGVRGLINDQIALGDFENHKYIIDQRFSNFWGTYGHYKFSQIPSCDHPTFWFWIYKYIFFKFRTLKYTKIYLSLYFLDFFCFTEPESPDIVEELAWVDGWRNLSIFNCWTPMLVQCVNIKKKIKIACILLI